MGQQLSRIAWEYHRSELETLYFDQKEPLPKLMTLMKERHNFHASKQQYEDAFREWGWRKNLNDSDYPYIKHRIEKRKAEDDTKESAVYLMGRRVDPKRIKRKLKSLEEVSLRKVGWYAATIPQSSSHARSPSTPEGVLVKTPGSPCLGESSASVPGIPDCILQDNSRLFQLRLDSLPSLQFEELVKMTVFSKDNTGIRHGLSVENCPASENIAPTTDAHISETDYPTSSRSITRQGLSSSSWTAAQQLLCSGNLDEHNRMSAIPTPAELYEQFSSLFIERSEEDLRSRINHVLGPLNDKAFSEYLVFLGTLASNNKLSKDQCDGLLQWIVKNQSLSKLRLFLSLKIPGISALARCMFESAIRTEAVEVVDILLKFGINPDIPISFGHTYMTPLMAAIQRNNHHLFKTLVEAGPNLNAYCRIPDSHYFTALHEAVRCGSLDFIRSLLDLGASIHPDQVVPSNGWCQSLFETAIRGAVDQRVPLDCEIIKELLDRGADVNAPTCISPRRTALQVAAASGNKKAIACLLDAGAYVNAPALNDGSRKSLKGGTLLQYCCFSNLQIKNQSAIDPTYKDAWDYDRDEGNYSSNNSIALMKYLLNAGIDVNAPAMFEVLLSRPTRCSFHGYHPARTALQEAAHSGNYEIVVWFVDAGADVNAQGNALRHAVKSRNSFIISKHLLENGADVNAWDGKAALEVAVKTQNFELVRLFLDAGADCNPVAGCRPLICAAAIKDDRISASIIKLLLAAGADVNAVSDVNPDETALVAAVSRENEQSIRLLLESGADVNPDSEISPFEIGYRRQNTTIVDLLSSYGAKLNGSKYGTRRRAEYLWKASDPLIPKEVIACAGHIQVYHRPDSGTGEHWVENSLAIMVRKRNHRCLQLMLEAGAELDGTFHGRNGYPRGDSDTTALLEAVLNSDLIAIRILLDAGADPNARPQPDGGWTALQEACRLGNRAIISTLLNAGADINMSPDEYWGVTALQAAALEGHRSIVKDLLKKDAWVNAPPAGEGGKTALQAAAIIGHLQITLDLLEAGADPNAPGAEEDGRTALEAAAEHGHLDIFQLLVNAGADIGGDIIGRVRTLAFENGQGIMVEYLDNMPGMRI